MLLEARHEDGSPMSERELRDELMTLLVAGHETAASELAWAFERLVRTQVGPIRIGDQKQGVVRDLSNTEVGHLLASVGLEG